MPANGSLASTGSLTNTTYARRVQPVVQWRRRQRRWRPPPVAAAEPDKGPLSLQASSSDACDSHGNSNSSIPASLGILRRAVLAAAAAAAAMAAPSLPAAASKLPEAVDRVWEGLGGGPADLVFPGGF